MASFPWGTAPINGIESFVSMKQTAVLEELGLAPVSAPAVSNEQAPIMTLSSYGGKLTREIVGVPNPSATTTHKLIPHIEVVEKLIEPLSFRRWHKNVRRHGSDHEISGVAAAYRLAQQSRQVSEFQAFLSQSGWIIVT
jgi:hypothetical protein